uniref:group II intron maturase-specific domain-containing protein n=1 Tax=Sphaerisporangium siamense TaxID=795645 RepID=UPI001620387F
MSAKARSWRLHRRVNNTGADLAQMINPVVRDWMAYYGAFYRHGLDLLLRGSPRRLSRTRATAPDAG